MQKQIENIARYETFILVGLILSIIVAIIKILGNYEFSSDWFWFLAGLALTIEGTISLIKQRKFDRKYKIIERKDSN